MPTASVLNDAADCFSPFSQGIKPPPGPCYSPVLQRKGDCGPWPSGGPAPVCASMAKEPLLNGGRERNPLLTRAAAFRMERLRAREETALIKLTLTDTTFMT